MGRAKGKKQAKVSRWLQTDRGLRQDGFHSYCGSRAEWRGRRFLVRFADTKALAQLVTTYPETPDLVWHELHQDDFMRTDLYEQEQAAAVHADAGAVRDPPVRAGRTQKPKNAKKRSKRVASP